jgi:hypothetical protein
VCEDIERSGRDTYNALKLERELGGSDILLFATDEPLDMEGTESPTIPAPSKSAKTSCKTKRCAG